MVILHDFPNTLFNSAQMNFSCSSPNLAKFPHIFSSKTGDKIFISDTNSQCDDTKGLERLC